MDQRALPGAELDMFLYYSNLGKGEMSVQRRNVAVLILCLLLPRKLVGVQTWDPWREGDLPSLKLLPSPVGESWFQNSFEPQYPGSGLFCQALGKSKPCVASQIRWASLDKYSSQTRKSFVLYFGEKNHLPLSTVKAGCKSMLDCWKYLKIIPLAKLLVRAIVVTIHLY